MKKRFCLLLLLSLITAFLFPANAIRAESIDPAFIYSRALDACQAGESLYILTDDGLYAQPLISGEVRQVIQFSEQEDPLSMLLEDGEILYGFAPGKGSLFVLKDGAFSLTASLDDAFPGAGPWADPVIAGGCLYAVPDAAGGGEAKPALIRCDISTGTAERLWGKSCPVQDTVSGESIAAEISWRNPFMMDGLIYALASIKDGTKEQDALIRGNPSTGSVEILFRGDIQSICPFDEGGLLMQIYIRADHGEKSIIASLGHAPGSRLLTLYTGSQGMGGLTFQPDTGDAYFCDGNEIKRIRQGIVTTVGYNDFSYISEKIRGLILPENHLALLSPYDDEGLRIYPADPQKLPRHVLRISGAWQDELSLGYMAAHPDVKLLFENTLNPGVEELITSMLTQDGLTDIYAVTSDSTLTTLADKGYTADLSSAGAIRGLMENAYPQIRELLQPDGKCIGIPFRFEFQPWDVHEELWQHLALGEYPRTYADFFRLVRRFAQEGLDGEYILFQSGLSQDRTLEGIMRRALKTYILQSETASGPLTFDIPDFVQTMKELRSAAEVFKPYGAEPALNGENVLLSLGGHQLNNDIPEPNTWLLPPAISLEGWPVVGVVMDVLIVNPNSPNADAAREYLAYRAENMDPVLRMNISAKGSSPIPNEEWAAIQESTKADIEAYEQKLENVEPIHRKDIEESISNLKAYLDNPDNAWIVPRHEMEAYQKLAAHMAFGARSKILSSAGERFEALAEIIRRFMAGKLPLEQATEALNKKAAMFFYEAR